MILDAMLHLSTPPSCPHPYLDLHGGPEVINVSCGGVKLRHPRLLELHPCTSMHQMAQNIPARTERSLVAPWTTLATCPLVAVPLDVDATPGGMTLGNSCCQPMELLLRANPLISMKSGCRELLPHTAPPASAACTSLRGARWLEGWHKLK